MKPLIYCLILTASLTVGLPNGRVIQKSSTTSPQLRIGASHLLRRMNPARSGRSADTGNSDSHKKQTSQNSVIARLSRHSGSEIESQQSRKRKKSRSGLDLRRHKVLLSTGDSNERQTASGIQAGLLASKFDALQAYTSSKSPDNWSSLRKVPSVESFQKPRKPQKDQQVPDVHQVVGIPPNLAPVKIHGDTTNGAYRKLVKKYWGDYSEGPMLRDGSGWNPE